MIKCQRRHHVTGCHSPATTSVLDGGLRGVHVAYGNYAKPGIARLEPGSQGTDGLEVDYVLTTLMTGLMEDDIVEAIRRRAKWENDDYICRGHILNVMSDSLFDIYQNVESAKELWDSLESKYMTKDASSKKFLESDKGKGKEFARPSVNMTEEGGKNKHHKQNKCKKRSNENNSGSSSNKKPKLECWKCGKTGHFKRDCRSGKKNNANVGGSGKGSKDQSQDQGQNLVPVWNRFIKYYVSLISEAFYVQVDSITWWIDSGATTHVCKDHCWFKTYEPVEAGSVLYTGNDHFTPIHGKGSVALECSSRKTITLFNMLYIPKLHKNLVSGPMLNKCRYKQVYESDKYILLKSGVFVGFGYYNNGMFMLNLNRVPDDSDSVYMSSSTVVNSSLWHARLGHVHYKRMLEMSKDDLIPAIDENPEKYTTYRGGEYYDPVFFQSVGIIHETTAPYTPQQNGVAERKNRALKEMVNSMLSYSGLSEGFWGEAMAIVRLSDPKRKTLGEKGIDCIFVGYAEHSKAYRFYVIEPNDSVSINSIIESRDAIFDENRFSSIPRPKDIIPNSDESQRDGHSNDVSSEIPEPRKVGSQYSYCYSIEEDLRTYNEAMKSRDSAFWKEAIDVEIGCKWIFKRKMKVDGTIDKFKARLVIQGFRQKEGIDYFDTYALVARITTIRLLLALAAIHNLVIHQMDVKKAFLNGDLEEEVYMKQPKGFVMPGNEHKICKLVKSLYSLKQAPKQWHQKFDEVVLSSGFLLNQSDKCVYSKFDSSGKGVIICLYVDDMLIFGTDQNQVDKTKKFLSSRFSMKDMGEADVILGIKIKRENKGIVITQSHYIEKILKKFNREDCSPVSTPMDPVEKLKPNTGKPVDQLEYSRAIGCLMYAMTSTRPDIPSVLEAYSDASGINHVDDSSSTSGWCSNASWINHVEDSSSTSGWVFLLGGGAISWASKKQTCITGSTMEYEFVALAAAGKEAEWLRNLIHEIPIWPKPIAPISIRCDSAPTMAKAYNTQFPSNTTLEAEFNVESSHLEIGTRVFIFPRCKTKRITYVNMKFCRFKKLGLGFLYSNGLTGSIVTTPQFLNI
ncbi:zinc finger, CCHC-type containing protein [Tanacetum coccineum]